MTCIFPRDGPLLSRIIAWRSVDCVNRTLRISPKDFMPQVSLVLPAFRKSGWLWVVRATTQSWYSFHDSHSTFVVAFSVLRVEALFWASHLVVLQPSGAGTDTCPLLCIPVQFYRIDIREDAQNSQGDLVQVPFKYYLHGCRRILPDWLLPLTLLFLDALLPRVIDGSEDGTALGVAFARSLLSCRKLHWSPFEHWTFSFHWQHIPSPLSTPLKTFRLLTTAPVPIFQCLAWKFRNRSFWSMLLFTIVFNFW